MLASRWLQAATATGDERAQERASSGSSTRSTARSSAPTWRCCASCMRHRWVVVLASLATLGSLVPAGQARCPRASCPTNDEAQFEVNVRAPEGTSLERDQLVAERIAREVAQAARGRRTRCVTIGDDEQTHAQPRPTSTCELVDPTSARRRRTSSWTACASEIVAQAAQGPAHQRRRRSPIFARRRSSTATCSTSWPAPTSTSSSSYADADRREAARRSPARSTSTPPSSTGKPELGRDIDRERAADLGVSVADVAARCSSWSAASRSRPTRRTASSTTSACAPSASTAPTPRRSRCSPCPRASSAPCRSLDVVDARARHRPVADQPLRPRSAR